MRSDRIAVRMAVRRTPRTGASALGRARARSPPRSTRGALAERPLRWAGVGPDWSVSHPRESRPRGSRAPLLAPQVGIRALTRASCGARPSASAREKPQSRLHMALRRGQLKTGPPPYGDVGTPFGRLLNVRPAVERTPRPGASALGRARARSPPRATRGARAERPLRCADVGPDGADRFRASFNLEAARPSLRPDRAYGHAGIGAGRGTGALPFHPAPRSPRRPHASTAATR